MSTDALLFAQDQEPASAELARITRTGRYLAFTNFEPGCRSNSLKAGPVPDYRPFLGGAGFAVEVYEKAPDWESRMRVVFAGILERRELLEQEPGEPVATLTLAWTSMRPAELSDSRRVLALARRN